LKAYSASPADEAYALTGVRLFEPLKELLSERFVAEIWPEPPTVCLGGILAREVAREYPTFVRQVISLGSPFASRQGGSNVPHVLFRILSGRSREEAIDERLNCRLRFIRPRSTAARTESLIG
jgi:hypothetical protein